MTRVESIAEAYAAIVAGCAAAEIESVWGSALFGRRLEDERLARITAQLVALRDHVGAESRRRSLASLRANPDGEES